MKYSYTEIKEDKRSRGCVISRVFIRYPKDVGNEKLNLYFKNEAESFYKFITETAFNKNEKAFSDYLADGGRRSLFVPTECRFEITVTSENKGVINVKTDVSVSKNGTAVAHQGFAELFDTETGTLCREKKCLIKK